MKKANKSTPIQQIVASHPPKEADRKALEQKVEAGTQKAIQEYGEVFRRLAEYDKT